MSTPFRGVGDIHAERSHARAANKLFFIADTIAYVCTLRGNGFYLITRGIIYYYTR